MTRKAGRDRKAVKMSREKTHRLIQDEEENIGAPRARATSNYNILQQHVFLILRSKRPPQY